MKMMAFKEIEVDYFKPNSDHQCLISSAIQNNSFIQCAMHRKNIEKGRRVCTKKMGMSSAFEMAFHC